ncbi:MAG: hypothetical protein JO303_04335 [Caulobacteraceae bacterium]|nr:hypothetical protein [Caulobacteraceae bacterium]
MRAWMIKIGFSALLLAVCAAPAAAHADCADRKMTGTVLGGVGGALIGGALGHGTGALIGGLGGAVVGHEVAAGGCRHYYRRYRYQRYGYEPPPEGAAYAPGVAPTLYYDQYGRPVGDAPYRGPCRTEMQSFYDDRANLVQRPVQVCAP